MRDFFDSVRTDLSDRRLLPIVGLVILALIASVAYVALGGGSGSATTSANVTPVVAPSNAGISVSAANATSEKAVAETTDGLSDQRKGSSRDPFTPLPGSTTTESATTPGTPSTTSSSTSSSSSSSEATDSPSTTGGSGGSTTGGEEAKPKAKQKKTVYHVAVEFGNLAPDPATGEPSLTPFVNLKLFTPLPSAKSPVIVFRGVTAGGKSATFTIIGEAILSGQGACLPSALECHAVDLKPGQTEQLEYLPAGSLTSVSYELKVLSIAHGKSASESAVVARVSQSFAGWKLLRNAHLLQIPDLHASSQAGVLVFAPQRAKIARAHLALRGPRLIG
jgi:hypothetical protein